MQKLGALLTSGKDSMYAMQLMKEKGFEIACAITIFSSNKDSFMFHTPAIEIVKLQSKALGIPLIIEKTKGEKEKELEDLKKAIKKAKEEHGIEGVITGALFSEYQSKRIKKICNELNLKVYSPLWHINSDQYLKDLIKNNFKVIITKIAAEGLDKSWLGREIANSITLEELKKLSDKFRFHLAFEGGEAETLVLDCPLFAKRLVIEKAEKYMESECCGQYIIKKARLINK